MTRPELGLAAVTAGAGALAQVPGWAGPVAAGLVAVYLSRLVFIDREFRRTHQRAHIRETLPLTGAAMMAAAGLIIDRAMTVPSAIYTGLGIGWVAVVALDLLGNRAVNLLNATFGGAPSTPPEPPVVIPGDLGDTHVTTPPPGAHPPPGETPADMVDLIEQVDLADAASKRKPKP